MNAYLSTLAAAVSVGQHIVLSQPRPNKGPELHFYRVRAWTVAMKSCAATSYAAQNSSESAIIRRSKGVLESGGS